ncbi:MAG: S8 family peptidase [Chitinophagaceae bacterium]
MKKNFLALLVISIVAITGCKKTTEQSATTDDLSVVNEVAFNAPGGQVVPNELLIKFKPGTGEKSRTQSLSFINAKVSEHILTNAMQSSGDNQGVYLVNTDTDVFAAIARMKGESNIEYAEPNWIYTHQVVSNDLYYTNGSLWGMYGDATTPANQYGSQAGEAWAAGRTGSSTVYVGVIDEGAMYSHDDLAVNFWTNPFDPVGGGDNDGNGYVDDVHGWDFAGNNNTTFDGTGDDHGTHVSGTIGAVGGNGKGVAGVNWAVTIISAKFLGANGGTTANAIKAVDYITDLKTRHGLNIVATNNSWGGGGFSQGLQDAVTRAEAENILFIAAAGNNSSNNDAVANYPSNYPNPNVIAVASITSTGGLSSFSNYGATQVDIGAPGSGIYSTLPAASGKGKNQTVTSSYGSYSGTSMATPHVAGAAALYASTHSGASAASIKSAILSSAVPTASLTGKCVTGGRLNVSGF